MGKSCRAACLLQVLFFPLFVAEQRQQTAGTSDIVQCLNNYGSRGRRVDCTWHRNGTLGEPPFHLKFSDPLNDYSDLICNLSASPEARDHFSCSVYSEEGEFTENDEYVVSLHAASLGKDLAYTVFMTYKPRLHIECDPPFGLQNKMSAGKCRIKWKKPEAFEDVGFEDWQWELAFKATKVPWEQAQTRILVSKETWMEIEGSEFKSGPDYVARIRCKTPDGNHHYRSQWSGWSATTEWKAPPGDWQQQQQQLHSPLPKAALISLLLSLGPLLFLILALRFFWRLSGAKIPSPAAFFQPLYAAHNGDFKCWVGHMDKGAWLRPDTENPDISGCSSGGGGSKDVAENAAVVLSQISFFRGSPEAEAAFQVSVCPLQGAPCCQYMASKHVTLEMEQKMCQTGCRPEAEPPLLSGSVSLQVQGQDARGKGRPSSLLRKDSFPVQDLQETEVLFFCSNDYCTLGGSDSQRSPTSAKLGREAKPGCS